MKEITFNLQGEYIELLQLLKAVNIAQTGGHAKMIVSEGEVIRNGEVELRKRAKIKVNETLIVGGEVCIKVV